MIRLRVYTDEQDEGGWYQMQTWWENLVNAAPGYTLGPIYALVEEWGGTVSEDFLRVRDEDCYIEFETEADATLFLLRWS